MSRPARAEINLEALAANCSKLRSLHGGRMLAVLKADAYGHGALQCAQRLRGSADGFAVAFAEEAMQLRSIDSELPVLVLEGAFSVQESRYCQSAGLSVVVHHDEQLRMLETAGLPARSIDVWLKVDSGMHRAGFALSETRAAYVRLTSCSAVREITLMTHFACADDLCSETTASQIKEFDQATIGLPGDRSLCNSAGVLAWPQARRDWGRSGIALYGVQPVGGPPVALEPVMRLTSAVFAVKDVRPGESVGYGAAFVAERPTRVGLVALGYADGYPRAAGAGGPVLVDGKRTQIIGRVSMDMITVDLTDLPESHIGSTVEFWGPGLDINEVATRAATIPYELLCNVKRVHRTYSQTISSSSNTSEGEQQDENVKC